MDRQPDENIIRILLQRLKAEDQQQLPSFDELLRRQGPAVDVRPSLHRWVVPACAAAAMLVVSCMLIFGVWSDSGRQPIGQLGHESVLEETQPAGVDFQAIRAAIDQSFVPSTVPEWKTPSDSLLAINLDVPLSQE